MSNLLVSSESGGEYTKKLAPLFGTGNSGLKNRACGDMRFSGMMLPGNWVRINWLALAGLTAVVNGSKIGRAPLKLPANCCTLGTLEFCVVPCRVRAPT